MTTLLTFTFSLFTVLAQESINVTGGNASGSGGSVGYSIGQVIFQTHTATNGSVAEGVQQPYEIAVVTGIEKAREIILTVSAYPNPTADYLILVVPDVHLLNFSFYLYDINGKLLRNNQITGNKTTIVMSNLLPATYFVKVIQGHTEVKIFKIVKK